MWRVRRCERAPRCIWKGYLQCPQWKNTVPKNSEALIRLEWRIRASRHTPVKEQFTGRKECKGYKK